MDHRVWSVNGFKEYEALKKALFWIQASKAGFSANLWMLGASAQDLLYQIHGKHWQKTEKIKTTAVQCIEFYYNSLSLGTRMGT